MKKIAPVSVQAKLCLNFYRLRRPQHKTRFSLQLQQIRLNTVLAAIFEHNKPEMVKYFIISQSWNTNDYRLKPEVSVSGLRTFLAQLNELVSAAYQYHHRFCVSHQWKDGGLRSQA